MRAILFVLIASPVFGQFPGDFGVQPLPKEPVKERPQAKPAPTLPFDAAAKVKAWLADDEHKTITRLGSVLDNHIVEIGKVISLEGCYLEGGKGRIWWNANKELEAISESKLDKFVEANRLPKPANDSLGLGVVDIKRVGHDWWHPSPIKGVALRVRYELYLDGKRYHGLVVDGKETGGIGVGGAHKPVIDATFLLDMNGNIFGRWVSEGFAIYDLRDEFNALGQRTSKVDYRAPGDEKSRPQGAAEIIAEGEVDDLGPPNFKPVAPVTKAPPGSTNPAVKSKSRKAAPRAP